jgi:hypothetical protein
VLIDDNSRLNCFNIRELESLLKRKFFNDLVNLHTHNLFLNNTIVSLRYKNNFNSGINLDQNIFYNYGISNLKQNKILNYNILNI